MDPLSIVVRTHKGEFSARLPEPTRANIAGAIEKLYLEHDEEILELRAEMPYMDQERLETFRYSVEEPDLSAEENAAWIANAVENFRY